MAEPLVLINAFEVPAEEADQFVAAGLASYRPHPGLYRVVRT